VVALNLFTGNTATLDFYPSTFTDAASLADAIRNITFRGGNSHMAEGLRLARTEIFNESNGDRTNVPDVIILVTDGDPTYDSAVLDEVQLIHDLGIRLVGVGVGTGVSDWITIVLSFSFARKMLKTSQFKTVRNGFRGLHHTTKTAKIKKVLLLLQHIATMSTCS